MLRLPMHAAATLLSLGMWCSMTAADVIFVNINANGANNGTSWADAFTDLHAALNAAQVDDEIWVAAAVYKPAEPGGDRLFSFHLRPGVKLYGGFAGHETKRQQRNWIENVTTLSGDLNGDDGPPGSQINLEENSCNVVRATGDLGPSGSALIDGFTITGGHANIGGPVYAFYGGGMFVQAPATPHIENCTFIGNVAYHYAGGLMFMRSNSGSGPPFGELAVINCRFEHNAANALGGALATFQAAGSLLVDRCIFLDNSVLSDNGEGGALAFDSGGQSWHVTNSVFRGNSAAHGGAIAAYTNGVHVANSLMVHNSASIHGGAISMLSATLWLFNCTIVENAAPAAGGVQLSGQLFHPTAVANCIMHDNAGGNFDAAFWTQYSLTYSNIGGGWPGEGNIDADPMFRNQPAMNYRLLAGSPCIDAGTNDAIVGESDLDGQQRVLQGDSSLKRVDIGAYEHRLMIAGDVNGDDVVNVNDLLAILAAWGECPAWPVNCNPDLQPLEGDSAVNVNDLLSVINNWG